MPPQFPRQRPVHTYSIVARDAATGQMGVAVQSHYFSVGPIVPWAEAGVGAVATQSLVRVDYGPEGLALMRAGHSAPETLAALVEGDFQQDVRQVAMIDAQGNVAAHTGERCIAAAGHLVGEGVSVQANLMLGESVWPAMLRAYEQSEGDLAARLLAALVAAQAAGGDIRGQQSAAMVVVSGERQSQPWQGRLIDLRVEDHPRPVEELARLLQLRRAYQLMDRSDELMVVGRFDEACAALDSALALAPDNVELNFWAGINRLLAGREADARPLLRAVFAKEPIWLDLLPRLVAAGLLPDDEAILQRIRGEG